MTSEVSGLKPSGAWRLDWSDLRLGLLAIYAVALLAIPSDIGLHLGALVLSPSRIVLTVLAVLVVADRSLFEGLRSAPRTILLAWLAFLACAAVTTLLNPSSQAVARYGSLVVEGLVLWAVVWCVARDARGSRVLQFTIVVTTAFVAGATLLLSWLGLAYGDVIHLSTTVVAQSTDIRFGLVRQEGSFPAPLFFATWLAGATMLILNWLEEERLLWRIMAWAAWVVMLLAAILTVSRVGIVVALAGTGIYFLLRRRRRIGLAMMGLAVVAALIMAGYTLPIPLGNLGGSSSGTGETSAAQAAQNAAQSAALSGSTELRFEAIKAAWPVLLEKPLFGWGLLSAGPVLSAQIGKPNYVDNTYVQWLVELGMLGLAAFGLLMLAVLGAAARLTWSPAHLSRVLALVVLLGMSALASFFSITQGYAAFVLVLALATIGAMGTDSDLAPGQSQPVRGPIS